MKAKHEWSGLIGTEKMINELLDEASQTFICRKAWVTKEDAPSDAIFNPLSGLWEESDDSLCKRLKVMAAQCDGDTK
jgi:hypothetical protein